MNKAPAAFKQENRAETRFLVPAKLTDGQKRHAVSRDSAHSFRV
jgi:hypothetical protein